MQFLCCCYTSSPRHIPTPMPIMLPSYRVQYVSVPRLTTPHILTPHSTPIDIDSIMILRYSIRQRIGTSLPLREYLSCLKKRKVLWLIYQEKKSHLPHFPTSTVTAYFRVTAISYACAIHFRLRSDKDFVKNA